MLPVLFEIAGVPVTGYGVSKALAVLVAGWLLSREFRRVGWDPDRAWSLATAGLVLGFAGGKVYYLAENAGSLSPHDFGPSGFTWYGGLLAGTAAVAILGRRYGLPLGRLAGLAVAPLSAAYGVGRIGCFLSGDGTYGKPSDLPWAVAFPNGTMPTLVSVHPTALYEAAFAFVLAGVLWALRKHLAPLVLVGVYAVASGTARFLVEEVRINAEAFLGLTQPQLWSVLLVAVGFALTIVGGTRPDVADPDGQTGNSGKDASGTGLRTARVRAH